MSISRRVLECWKRAEEYAAQFRYPAGITIGTVVAYKPSHELNLIPMELTIIDFEGDGYVEVAFKDGTESFENTYHLSTVYILKQPKGMLK